LLPNCPISHRCRSVPNGFPGASTRYDEAIGRVAAYGLDCYPHVLEVISAEQMMDAYASIGMPVYYHHWSFGKHFLATENRYKRGQMGLAYEIVINSDPCIAYLMDENTLPMQALVIAHAAYGHNSFFKGNHLFKQWTSADAIIDYLVFARNYIAQCEEQHGVEAVERLLDACHALRTSASTATSARRSNRWKRRAAPEGTRGVHAGAGQRPVAHPAAPR
jgi:stage V sporulation protein R